jgi:MFS family permease
MTAAILALQARTFASVRKHRNYRLFFTGQVISLVGTWMQNIALAWYVIELTHSAVAVGFLAFCRFAPFTIFGLVSGVVADRLDNRRLVMGTQTASMIVAGALTVLALSGAEIVWLAYLLAFAAGTALVFDAPGRHALTFQMVGREELPNAVALNASLFNASRVVGPAAAGVIIAAFGVTVCFALNTLSFLAVLTSLALMRPDELFAPDRPERHQSVLAMTMVVSTVGFNFHVLVPVLASETLDAGPRTFGILSAAFGAGALVGALLSATLARASWPALLTGVGGFSVALLALAPLHTVVGCVLLLFVVGICFTLWTSNSQSLLQLSAPDHLRGRVVSLYLFAFAGLAPLGGLLAGWLSEVGGTELAFGVAGVTGLLMTALALRELYAGKALVSSA